MRLKFSELFDVDATGVPAYGKRCAALSGTEVEITGWLSPAHDGSGELMLVERSGECPDCSPVPAITLPGFTKGEGAVTLRGRLSYGFATDHRGKGSFLRLEGARLAVTKLTYPVRNSE